MKNRNLFDFIFSKLFREKLKNNKSNHVLFFCNILLDFYKSNNI